MFDCNNIDGYKSQERHIVVHLLVDSTRVGVYDAWLLREEFLCGMSYQDYISRLDVSYITVRDFVRGNYGLYEQYQFCESCISHEHIELIRLASTEL